MSTSWDSIPDYNSDAAMRRQTRRAEGIKRRRQTVLRAQGAWFRFTESVLGCVIGITAFTLVLLAACVLGQ